MTRRKYTKEVLQEAANSSTSYAGILRVLGIKQAGGSQSNIIKACSVLGVDVSHFTGQSWSKDRTFKKRAVEEILVVLPEGSHRPKTKTLLNCIKAKEVPYSCSECGLGNIWNGKSLTLEIDHISGDWLDNRLENLRFLCPNCHSQQETNKPYKNR